MSEYDEYDDTAYFPKKSYCKTCSDKDFYILKLEKKVAELERKYSEAVTLAFNGALASDRMKLELIMNGCLTRPKVEPQGEGVTDMREAVAHNPTTE